jgi:hypothetical protein
MKTLSGFLLCGLLFCNVTNACAQHIIKKLWATDSVVAIPESVLPVKDILYVSEIDGAPWGRDGKGEVGKLTRDGKIIDLNWITGYTHLRGWQ